MHGAKQIQLPRSIEVQYIKEGVGGGGGGGGGGGMER